MKTDCAARKADPNESMNPLRELSAILDQSQDTQDTTAFPFPLPDCSLIANETAGGFLADATITTAFEPPMKTSSRRQQRVQRSEESSEDELPGDFSRIIPLNPHGNAHLKETWPSRQARAKVQGSPSTPKGYSCSSDSSGSGGLRALGNKWTGRENDTQPMYVRTQM